MSVRELRGGRHCRVHNRVKQERPLGLVGNVFRANRFVLLVVYPTRFHQPTFINPPSSYLFHQPTFINPFSSIRFHQPRGIHGYNSHGPTDYIAQGRAKEFANERLAWERDGKSGFVALIEHRGREMAHDEGAPHIKVYRTQ